MTPLGPQRCNVLVHIISSLATATTCLGTILFLVRARGALFGLKWARRVLTVWWFLAIVAVVSTVPFSFTGLSIVESNLCAVRSASDRQAIGSVSVAAFDGAVFLAISFRVGTLDRHLAAAGRWSMLKAFLTGSSLGPLSKTLLRTGQLFYL